MPLIPDRSGDLRTALLVACTCFLALAAFHRGHFVSSDETGVFEVTRALAEEGSLEVRRIPYSSVGRDGRRFSDYAIGQSVLALPFYALGAAARHVLPESWQRAASGPGLTNVYGVEFRGMEIFAIGLYSPFATGVLAALFFLFQRELGVSLGSAVLAALLLAGSTHAALMGTLFLRHTTEAIAILGGFLFLFRWAHGGRGRDLALGSLLVFLTILIRLPASLAVPGLGAYALWGLLRRRRDGRPAEVGRALLAIAVPLALVMGVHVAVNYTRWGTLLDSPMLGQRTRLFQTPLSVGGYANLFSPGSSIFAYSPLLLLAPWTFARFRLRYGPEALAILAVFACFFLVGSTFEHWTGLWSAPGPRYLFPALPLLMLPLGTWLDARRGHRARAAFWVLAALGVAIQLSLVTTDWKAVVEALDYRSFQPQWGFLFQPEHSPIAGSMRFFLRGELNDTWLLRLARGARGVPAMPVAAAILASLLGLAVALCALALRRRCRRGAAV